MYNYLLSILSIIFMSDVKKNIKKKEWEDPEISPLNLSDTEAGANPNFTERTSGDFPLGTPFAAS